MKIKSKIACLAGNARLGAALALTLLISLPVQAANDFWAGVPSVSTTTNWTDAANWTYAGQSSPQTYYNQVEFTGVGANANNNFAVNNVLDDTTGVAQMPMWELDYIPTNGNYTTLINPGVTMTVGVGNHGYLAVGADQLNGSSPAPANAVETITITGSGGTLNMAGSGANLWVGQGSPTPGDSHNIILNLSGLDTFNDSAGAGSGNFIHVAYGNQSQNSSTPNENGTLYLARTNVISLGSDLQICNTPGTNSMTCGVYLGIYNYILTGTGNLIVGGPGTGPAGAVMAFNPAFVGGASVPVAYLGGNGADGRIANFYIGYANGNSQVSGAGLCDFTGGTVTVMADTMQLGQGGNAGANSQGTLNFNDGSVNVNNATIGNQEVSSGGTGVGIVSIGTNATLTVNNTLTLAAVTGTLTHGTAGTVNINGGALAAGSIVNGAGVGTISATNGTLTLTGAAGAPAAPVSNLSFVNSTLDLAVQAASTNIIVSSLTTGGTTNFINITSVPEFPSYPVQVKLIKYPATIAGAGYDFGLGTLPALCSGYLSNDIANASVDLVLTSGPAIETWTGSANGNWDTTTANWLAGGSPATYANGDSVQFLDGASVGTVNLTTSLSPNSVTVSNAALNYTFDGSGLITGPTALLKQGSGTLVIDNGGNNNFSGGITIGAGALQVGNNDTSGNLPGGNIADNGVLVFDRTDTPTVGNTISGSGALVQAGAGGTLQLGGANTFTGPVVVTNGSTLKLGSSSAVGTGTNNLTIANGSTLDANGYTETKPIIVSGTGVGGNGAIINSGGAIYDNPGPGLATNIMLAGNTTFTFNSPNRWDLGSSGGGSVLGALGAYNLTLNGNGGYFEWQNLSVRPPLANITIASGTLGVVGATTFGDPSATLILSPSATLTLYGANVFVNKQVDFQDGATINNAGGANVMDGKMTLEAGYDTFNVGGGTTLTLSNVLAGSGTFYQSGGSGTTILTGNSPSFTGGVLLYNGQLTLNGLIGSGITSQPGTTVYGTGTANGLVDIYGAITPGGTGVAGTLNAAGGLTLESGATLTMNLSPSTSGNNSAFAVTGNLTVNGNNVTINPLSGTLASGTYTLFTYTGSLTGTFGAVSTAASSRYSFSLSTSTPHQVNLIVSGQPNLLEWNNGANNGEWDVQSSLNWSNLTTHAEDQFFTADAVLFDDTILSAPHPATSIDIASGQIVAPSVVTNNSTANYTISGAGKISGAASIVKLGTSTLTMSTTNDFTGNFIIGGGTVQLNGITAVAGATNGALVISNGATLAVNLSGSYPVGDAGFGNKPIVVSGAGVNGQGAIQFTGGPLYSDSSTLGLGQNITLTGNTTISGAGRFDWGYPGAGTTLSTHGSNYNLTVSIGGYSQWYDIGIDTNLGNIDLYTSASSQQTLRIEALGASLGNPTNVLTLHSNIVFSVQHGDTTAGDNGYAKVVHILPTAAWQYQPSGGAGDYRLNTSFVLETNAGLYFYGVDGGSGSGVAIAGTVTLNGLANFQIGNAPVTFSNVISGAGGFYLNQYGGYPLVFAAANTYQGITDIRSGMVLALTGNGSISKSTPISLAAGATLAVTNRTDGTLTLANGQTLQGSGVVQGVLASSAGSTVAPGTSGGTGTLTVSGNTTLNGNTMMKLNGANNDVLSVGDTLTYGGMLTLTNISAIPFAAGNSFTLFSAGGYSGSFAGITPAVPGTGLVWNTNNLIVNGTISVVSTAAPVPRITKIGLSGTTLTIQGTNGTPNGQYVLLQSTNVALAVTNWTPVLTNKFEGNGNLDLSTNIVNPNAPQEFYILKTQ
jgi:autotransporter-associated beta strand protein